MLKHIRSMVVIALAAGLMWNCGGERVTQSQTGTKEQVARPLSKLAAHQHTAQAVVMATLHRDGAPISGATIAFSRSVAGQAPDYQWSGTTDENGQARVEIASGNGYYQARASQDGIEIGSWSSIPINTGYEIMLDLPIGGQAQVTSSSMRKLVTIGEGEAVHIRSILAHVVVPSVATWARYNIELAIRDFGSIHGHEVELGEPIDGMCFARGRTHKCRASHRRPADTGRHRHIVFWLSGGGLTSDQRSRSGDDLADQHIACTHIRPRWQCEPQLPPRLFPHG